MNANEYKLQQLTYEIQYYETENSSVKQYNQLKRQRDDLLNDISNNW